MWNIVLDISHILISLFVAKSFISAVFYRLRKEVNACQPEDPDVRRLLSLHIVALHCTGTVH